MVAIGIIYYVYLMFTRELFHDFFLLLIIKNFRISKPYAVIMMVVSVILQLQSIASWVFTQATKCAENFLVVCTIVYSQYFVMLVLIDISKASKC